MSDAGKGHYANTALHYCNDVLSGKVLAAKWVRLACQRHLEDLERAKSDGWSYRFDVVLAYRACKFVESLSHTKGKWARPIPGKPSANLFKLEPWQCFVLVSLFGWVKKSNGLRRFRTALIMVPRKNGKSQLAACIGLYMFSADGEYGAEVFSGATTEKQAWETYRPARLMALKSDAFRKHFGVTVNAKSLTILSNGSRFEPLIGDPGDGSSPSCAIVDEYHEHETDKLYSTMETGMGAREQPLMLAISTAGDNIAGPCYQMQKEAQQVLEGILHNDEFFAVIYGIDDGDDWSSIEALKKANPNYGVSVLEEFLLSELHQAKQSARKQGAFKTKHLNQWVSARNAWMNMEWWNKCADPALKPEDFRGEPCYLGLDLASKIDIAARVQVFVRTIEGDRHYYVFGKYYLPESALQEKKTDHYKQWATEGWLTITDGDEIDLNLIQEDITGWDENGSVQGGLIRDFQVEEVAYDPWQATQLAQNLTAQGATVVEYRNTVANMSAPMKEIEGAAKAGRLHHNGDPMLAWMISNVVAKEDAKENIFPRKEASENKIDAAIALIMSIGRAMHAQPKECAYDTRGVLTL